MARPRTLVLVAALWVMLPAGVFAGQTFYITDQVEITLRSGPSLDFKIMRMLVTGTPLEALEESEGWTHVRTPEGDDGWVVSRYLSGEPPKAPLLAAAEKRIKKLETDLARVRTELKASESEGNRSASEARKLSRRLEKVKKEYAAWKKTNADVLALKQKADTLETQQGVTQAELGRYRTENRALKARERFYWFFSGAIVLLLGWMLGYMYAASRMRAKGKAKYRI